MFGYPMKMGMASASILLSVIETVNTEQDLVEILGKENDKTGNNDSGDTRDEIVNDQQEEDVTVEIIEANEVFGTC